MYCIFTAVLQKLINETLNKLNYGNWQILNFGTMHELQDKIRKHKLNRTITETGKLI